MLPIALLLASTSTAQVEGYPLLDNESIGLSRALAQAVEGDPAHFDEVQWSRTLIDTFDDEGVMSPLRYLIAFSAYSIAQSSRRTPAWREPSAVTFEGYLRKMEQPAAWEDFVILWEGVSPFGPGNVMYTGHLAYMMTQQQQLYTGAANPSVTLVATDGRTWTTDYLGLIDSLSNQANLAVDGSGEPTWSVACEPGQIFVPCNTPHRVGELVFDQLHGQQRVDTLPQWLSWVQGEMLDEEHQVLHDLYFPSGTPGDDSDTTPRRHARISGAYNAWTLWFLLALDADWAVEHYPDYVDYFVVRGEDSPYDDGRTVVIDDVGSTWTHAHVMNMIATGFGMVAARAFGDDELAAELEAGWSVTMGPATWEEGNTVFTHTALVLPRVFQNSFDLLARTVDPVDPLGLAAVPYDSTAPRLASISHPTTFVNQAWWDADLQQLVLTVNGGGAVTEPVELTVAGLPAERSWSVTRNGEAWEGFAIEGDSLVITTHRLNRQLDSYIITEAVAVDEGGCSCTSAPAAAGWLGLVGLLALGWRRRG